LSESIKIIKNGYLDNVSPVREKLAVLRESFSQTRSELDEFISEKESIKNEISSEEDSTDNESNDDIFIINDNISTREQLQ
jgi:hypothetical protein